MVNYEILVQLPRDYHATWQNDLIEAMDGELAFFETKLYGVRVNDEHEKKFLEKLKTYDMFDHEGGKYRIWKKGLWNLVRFIRPLLGLGSVPITPCFPINTPGHVVIVARFDDKKDQNGATLR